MVISYNLAPISPLKYYCRHITDIPMSLCDIPKSNIESSPLFKDFLTVTQLIDLINGLHLCENRGDDSIFAYRNILALPRDLEYAVLISSSLCVWLL